MCTAVNVLLAETDLAMTMFAPGEQFSKNLGKNVSFIAHYNLI